jgi:hypothetical protein
MEVRAVDSIAIKHLILTTTMAFYVDRWSGIRKAYGLL